MKINLIPNKDRTGFSVPSEYNKNLLSEWIKKYSLFTLEPVVYDHNKSRRYLEGGVIPAYCEWQYGINARDPQKDEARRYLFKKDFNYEIKKNRKGDPVKIPVSSKGKVKQILENYTRYAQENGAPIPNPELYKLWRDKWSLDYRFPTFFEFIDFLGLECDAMPSDSVLNKLEIKDQGIKYPKNNLGEPAF